MIDGDVFLFPFLNRFKEGYDILKILELMYCDVMMRIYIRLFHSDDHFMQAIAYP